MQGATRLEIQDVPASGKGSTTSQATVSQTTNLTNCMLDNCEPVAQDLVVTRTCFFLDYVSPTKLDNYYFRNLLAYKCLLSSDEVLFTKSKESMELMKIYAENNNLFFEQFAKSMTKMGNISPLTGSRGDIRKNGRKVNSC
ncbi:hypothetical protein NE237_016579 [Protea cynaroides]|uniref:Plant heme peroxidase family profile domain-containing protein n=1 Tax=Protea cynaroides TaxID=273540 RepID=A0A9Q0K6V4_9MAGN|nr:hypothetical protein NE237_016579 [Protea cynaroides]